MTAAMTACMTLDCFYNQAHDSSDSRQATISCVRVRVCACMHLLCAVICVIGVIHTLLVIKNKRLVNDSRYDSKHVFLHVAVMLLD